MATGSTCVDGVDADISSGSDLCGHTGDAHIQEQRVKRRIEKNRRELVLRLCIISFGSLLLEYVLCGTLSVSSRAQDYSCITFIGQWREEPYS